jgi:hypothetical protein
MGWVGNDAAKDLYIRYDGTWHFLAKVRPRGDGFAAIVFNSSKSIPVGEYATQEEAQVAAIGFIKLLTEK